MIKIYIISLYQKIIKTKKMLKISTKIARQTVLLNGLFNIRLLNYTFAIGKQNIPRRFQNRMPKRQKIFTVEDRNIEYNPFQAIQLMKYHGFCTFRESVQICIHLNVNPKNGDQIVRGSVFMPSGIGKQTKVAVLCSKDQYDQLQSKGLNIDIFLNEVELKKLEKGIIDFDKLFTTPDYIGKLKHLGKALGPKGLMPNSKVGTLVKLEELQQKIKQAKFGQVTFRVDSGKNLHALIGKIDFTDEQLLINFRQIMKSLADKKPNGLKGKYFLGAYLKSTMGPRWKINMNDIDPRVPKNIWTLFDSEEESQQKLTKSQAI